MSYADRVKQTTVTTGQGAITLGAASAGYRAIADAYGAGARIPYCIESQVPGQWEVGVGTLVDATHLARTTVTASSSAGALVDFAAGTKNVMVTATAGELNKLLSLDDVAYSASVPLNTGGIRYMPQQTVAGPIAFSVAGTPVKHSQVYLRLVANGANTPTFPGFAEWGGSMGYDNRNGIANQIIFFHDGVESFWSGSQAVGATAADNVAPTASSATVQNAAPTSILITSSEQLNSAFVPAASAFTVGGHTVSAVGVSGSSITLTVSAFVNGEAARTVTYAQPGTNQLRDVAGNLMAAFTGLAITNNVAAVDSAAPSFASAQVSNASPSVIQITMNEALAATTPAASAFAVSGGKAVSSVAIAGTVVSVTVNSAYANGDNITVTYTQPGTNRLADAAGNPVASFGPSAVANNVGAAATAPATMVAPVATAGDGSVSVAYSAPANGGSPITSYTATHSTGPTVSGAANPLVLAVANGVAGTVTITATNAVGTSSPSPASNSVTPAAAGPSPRLGLLSGVTESGTGPYSYAGTGGNYTASPGPGGVLTTSLANSASGSVSMAMDGISATKAPIIGLVFNSNLAAFSALTFGIFAQLSSNSYKVLVGGAVTTANVSVLVPAVGDRMRLRRAGTAVFAEISRAAAPTAYTVIHNFAAASSTALFAQLLAAGDGVITNIETVGFA